MPPRAEMWLPAGSVVGIVVVGMEEVVVVVVCMWASVASAAGYTSALVGLE